MGREQKSDNIDEVQNVSDNDRKFENEYGVNWYWYCNNNPVIYLDLTGLLVRVYSYGIGGYVFVGGQASVGWASDDQGNHGIIISAGGGVGLELSLGKGGKAKTPRSKGKAKGQKGGFSLLGFSYQKFDDVDTIYDLMTAEWYGDVEISSSTGPIVIDDNGRVSWTLNTTFGGHSARVWTVLIPCGSAREAAKGAWKMWLHGGEGWGG
jgi:hypothetical protein